MDEQTRQKMRQVAADLAATTGQSFSRVYATLHTEANIETEAERRGAVKALREAADAWYSDDGPDHPLSAQTWLRARADALDGPVEERKNGWTSR